MSLMIGLGLGLGGRAGGGSSFSPTDLTWGMLLMPGNYEVVAGTGTWTATVGPDMLDSAAEPAEDGTNGWPNFVAASTEYLNTATATTGDIATTGAGTIVLVARPDIAAATNAAPAEEAAIFTDNAGRIGVTFTTDGFTGFMTDGSYKELTIAAAAASAYFVAFRWDSSNLKLRVNATDATPVACGALSSGAGVPRMGRNYASTAYDGLVKFCGVASTALSDANLTSLYTWAQAQGLV